MTCVLTSYSFPYRLLVDLVKCLYSSAISIKNNKEATENAFHFKQLWSNILPAALNERHFPWPLVKHPTTFLHNTLHCIKLCFIVLCIHLTMEFHESLTFLAVCLSHTHSVTNLFYNNITQILCNLYCSDLSQNHVKAIH